MDKSIDIFEDLKFDHRKVAALINDLQKPSQEKEKTRVFCEIREELEIHASAEEQTVYPFLEKMTSTEGLAEEADEEHNAIRDALETLAALEPEDEGWAEAANSLKEVVSAHVNFEETKIFAALRRCSSDQLRDMQQDFEKAKEHLKREIAA
jgi:hemerythrin superfamily protein